MTDIPLHPSLQRQDVAGLLLLTCIAVTLLMLMLTGLGIQALSG